MVSSTVRDYDLDQNWQAFTEKDQLVIVLVFLLAKRKIGSILSMSVTREM